MIAPVRMIMLLALAPVFVFCQPIVNDSWTDGGRTNGADPWDTNWWASTNSNAIEVTTGSLGLVNRPLPSAEGNGIHAIFTPQALNVGDSLTVAFTFTTPDTVGDGKFMALRVGLFDSLGRTGLAADQLSSGVTADFLYNGLPGYWVDWDVDTASSNITFRQHNTAATSGQLLADGNDYPLISAGGSAYTFAPNSTYEGVFAVTRTGASSMSLIASISQGGEAMSTYFDTDVSGIVSSFDMLAFHLTPSAFGANATPGMPDNGIDFSNVIVVASAVPEPTTFAALMGAAALGLATLRRRFIA